MILDLFFALVAGLLVANILPGNSEALFRFLLISVSFYIAKVWWLLLVIVIIPILFLRFIHLQGLSRRFWFFLIVAGMFPLISNALLYTYVVSHLSLAEQQTAAQNYGDKIAASEQQWKEEKNIAQQAITANNLNSCYSLKNARDMCIEKIAEQRKDFGLCMKLNAVDWKNGCYTHFAQLLGDVTFCDNVKNRGIGSTYDVDHCIEQVAIVRKNVTLCKQLGAEEPYCIYSVAYTAKDPVLCDLIDTTKTYRLQETCRDNANPTSR